MASKLDPVVLVVDVESTCWEPPEAQPKNEISEIIEIGVTEVNTRDQKILKSASIMVRPQKSKVSKFCTKLTTLTQEMVDKGVYFDEAMSILRKQYKSDNRVMVSWGDYDRKMFERNSKEYGVKYPFGPRHLNLKNTFALLERMDYEPGMDDALDYLGLELEGTHHRGIDDSRNIARVLCHVLTRYHSGSSNPDGDEDLG
jgi:inhibitor of KinA sporulation pathway (predicted exonuclease)